MKTGITFLDKVVTTSSQDRVLGFVIVFGVAISVGYAVHLASQETITALEADAELQRASVIR